VPATATRNFSREVIMAKVYPFRSLRYALSRIPVEKVVTQPYDKISKQMQDRYYELHPSNLIRIVLGRPESGDGADNNVYTRAARLLKEWRQAGIIERLEASAFFVYFQRFTIPGTSDVQVRKGFVGAAQLEDYANKIVFPHERTLSGPKKDRLELLRHTQTHFEQIFMLYEDAARRIDQELERVARSRPDLEVLDEYGVLHSIWTVTDPAIVKFIAEQMSDKTLIIADGHHRYETALAYRDEMRTKTAGHDPNTGYERMAMTFFNMDAPGLTILPTHRVIRDLERFDSDELLKNASEFFEIRTAPPEAGSLRAALKAAGEQQPTVGLFTDGGGRTALLALKSSLSLTAALPDLSDKLRRLDVVILHRLLLEKCLGISEEAVKKQTNITYFRELDKALKEVETGAQAAFLLNPTGLHQMRDVAYGGDVMPQKSTDFYPKVLSGLIMYPLDES
jgi:uncharacterized protein (DUF1015 family)